MAKEHWIYIENYEGTLFRGIAAGLPREIWDDKKRQFRPYDDGGGKPEGWGEKIDEARARELMGL